MQDRGMYFNDGKKLQNWGLLDLVNLDERSYGAFIDALYNEGAKRGLGMEYPVRKNSGERDLGRMEKDFVALYNDLKKKGKPGKWLIQ